MPKSFTITSSATGPLTADAKGHAQVVFTVTNITSRPVRGIAKIKPLGDTNQEWLTLDGESKRDIGGAATEQFSVNFDAVGAPAGKYMFQLVVSSGVNPVDDVAEGAPVTVEIAAVATPPPVEKKKFPLWIILVIVGVVVVIGIVVLIIVLSSRGKGKGEATLTPTPAEASPTPSKTTPTPAPEGKEFRVTAATLSANPNNHAGPCPVLIRFTGSITVNKPGTVRYTFVRSDGARDTRDLSLNFDGPGSKDVETTWTLGAAVPIFQPFRGFQRIKTLSPNEMESDNANFVLNCR